MGVFRSFTVLFLFFSSMFSSEVGNIDYLLSQYAQKDDLSLQTKKESAGYLYIFTRADLDMMHVKSLYELVEKVPFIRYNENSAGLSDTNYSPYQNNVFSHIKIYINEKEMIAPFSGNGFQLLGQIDMGYIDHVEIYMGIPSFEIGTETSLTIIKLYTKKGDRENTSVFGTSFATRGTTDTFVYKSESMDDFSYLFYLNSRNLNREPVYNNSYKLSKDKNSNDLYAEIENNNYRFELQCVNGYMNNFMGESWDITPSVNKTDFWYIYSGLYYSSDDRTFKMSLNYAVNFSKNVQHSDGHLGYIPISVPPFYMIYDDMLLKLREDLSDIDIKKSIESEKNTLLIGLRGRYKKFVFKDRILGSVSMPKNSYDTEYISSLYFDDKYYINEKSILTGSVKFDKYFESGSVRDYRAVSGRLGYIYNTKEIGIKSFLFYGDITPTPYVLYYQNILSPNDIKKQKVISISSEITYRREENIFSFLIARNYYKDAIYFNGLEYKNLDDTPIYDTFSFRNTYNIKQFGKIEFNFWIALMDLGKNNKDRYRETHGGYLSVFNSVGRFDFYNSLSFICNHGSDDNGYNLNSTITYRYNKDISFYLKGENLLNDAIETTYYRYNPLTTVKTTLDNVNVFDRRVWLGLEYQF